MTKKKHPAFAERLKTALEAVEIDTGPSELEKVLARCGVAVTSQAISSWFKGKHMPRPEAMQALAFIAGVEPYWLQFGKPTKGIGEDRNGWGRKVSGDDRVAIEAYLSLPATTRRVVRELIHILTTPSGKRGG